MEDVFVEKNWKSLNFFKTVADSAAQEALAHLKALRLYPFGHPKLDREKGVEHPPFGINRYPVLLVHGVVHNRSAFFTLKKEMQAWGWTNVFTMNYSTWHGSLTGMIEDLALQIEKIKKETGASQVDVVAHSLGGLVARYFMTTGYGRGSIRQLLTLGTAHQGAHLSGLLRFFLGGSLHRDLKRESYFIQSLNEVSLPRKSRIVSIYTKKDRIVWPYTNSLLDEGTGSSLKNIEVDSAGHISLLYDRSVFLKIHDLLLESYSDGPTGTPGSLRGRWIRQLEENVL